MYFTKTMATKVLTNITKFENELDDLFKKYNQDLRQNLGRRNALVSQYQESTVAEVLREVFDNVIEDGAPGKPDVQILDIQKELECKLTSGSKSKGSVSYSLQTDWRTICKKGSLDYLYILADEKFENFCVLFFEGLTSDDFFPPAAGSRGKSRMRKASAMKKCTVLHGGAVNLRLEFIKRYEDKVAELNEDCYHEVSVMLTKCTQADLTVENAGQKIKAIEERYEKKIAQYQKRIEKWKTNTDRWSYKFAPVS